MGADNGFDTGIRYDAYHKLYKNIGLEEYSYNGEGSPYDDSDKYYPEAGWKFHLNVAPEKVKQVAVLLKFFGFHHKYLSGGEIEAGKIFTVYTGSKEMTEGVVKIVSLHIGHLLDKQVDGGNGEAEFAPNIVGRFEGKDEHYYRKVSKNGVCIARDLWSPGTKITEQQRIISHNRLLEAYGEYYGGGITYYQPKTENKMGS